MSSDSIPKAILYSWPSSVWSTVPRLCLYEKGYAEDEYIVKHVDVTKGENFAPSFLKINFNGTIPTLVVPTIETTGTHVDTRYRSLRDTITICDFLDQARSANTASASSDRPAPTLAPATIEGKALADMFIALIHKPTNDPNFLALSARDADELKLKASTAPGKSLDDRRQALKGYLAEAKEALENAPAAPKDGSQLYEQRIVAFLEEKIKSNEQLWQIFNGQAGKEREQVFFDVSRKTWTEALPDAFSTLESSIKGPFALGDQVSLADLHVIAWLTRLASIAGGKPASGGLVSLEPHLGGYKFGPKLLEFWELWVKRESYQKALVPAEGPFASMSGR